MSTSEDALLALLYGHMKTESFEQYAAKSLRSNLLPHAQLAILRQMPGGGLDQDPYQ